MWAAFYLREHNYDTYTNTLLVIAILELQHSDKIKSYYKNMHLHMIKCVYLTHMSSTHDVLTHVRYIHIIIKTFKYNQIILYIDMDFYMIKCVY